MERPFFFFFSSLLSSWFAVIVVSVDLLRLIIFEMNFVDFVAMRQNLKYIVKLNMVPESQMLRPAHPTLINLSLRMDAGTC